MQGSESAAPIVDAETYGKWHPQVVMMSAPRGAAAEQYRVLRQRLLPAIADGARRIAVTSTTVGEGRTTTAVNLALALAAGRQLRVALVDADLRAADRVGARTAPLHALLGLTPQAGIVDVALGDVALDATLWRFGVEELHVLPAGRTRDAHAVWTARRMAETLDALGARFDVVIVDAPPILPTADALVLATQVDAMVVVVRAGHTSRELLTHALSALPPVRILGAVLHRADAGIGVPWPLLARHDRDARLALPSPRALVKSG